jgi:hypothetical protein
MALHPGSEESYWQVVLTPDNKEKVAFSMGKRLWQLTIMPFGVSNAPVMFEQLMEAILTVLKSRPWCIWM